MKSSDPSARFHLGIVTGLNFEADIARDAIRQNPPQDGDSVTVTCHGPGQERSLSAAKSLLDFGATALLSFGVGGGCKPGLSAGTVIVSTGVHDLTNEGRGSLRYTNREWRKRAKALLPGSVLIEEAMIASVNKPIASSCKKRCLFTDINTAIVDMESAAVAHAAIEVGAPFMALRAVVDDADTTLSPTAMAGIREDGASDTNAVFRSLLLRPQDLPGLIVLAVANVKAKRALARVAAGGAPLFGAN
jgi:nucleoside phosphorylase